MNKYKRWEKYTDKMGVWHKQARLNYSNLFFTKNYKAFYFFGNYMTFTLFMLNLSYPVIEC